MPSALWPSAPDALKKAWVAAVNGDSGTVLREASKSCKQALQVI